MTLRRLACAFVLASCALRAQAFPIEYGVDRATPLVKCDQLLYRGSRMEAQTCYRALVADSKDTRIRADAARASGDVRGANGLFQVAIKEYPQDASVRVRWGELFLATHQNNEAVKLFQEALELDGKYAPAMLGLARVAASGFEEKTREYAKKVIDEAPDQSAGAHLLLARAALEDGSSIDAADKEIDRALELIKKHDFSPLEAYALKASADLLRGTTDSPWTKRALSLNPGYGEAYATPAYFYVITRRYREAIALLNKAVEVEPDLYSAHTELGVNLLRENKIAEAQQHLAIAYKGDPFSAPVVNTLRLIDSFANFVALPHEADTKRKDAVPNKGSILRLHKKEAPVMEPYVLDLVNRTIATYTKRYGFELKQPVVVELYPQHDDFGVRVAGLPGIGLLGVTFGYLVAMDSPARHADADFHWGTTLWHEMAHVFTLEATAHLVPRWFSEGVSVFEEWTTGPLKGRHIPPQVFKAIKEGKFLPIADLDRGFIRPMYEQQVIVSYMQAGLTCEYVAGRFGQAGLKGMLDQFGMGKTTAQAVEAALKITPAEFDKDFKAYVEQQLGTVVAQFEPWQHALAETSEAVRMKDWRLVTAKAAHAIELFPDYVDQGSPYVAKARAHKELKETALMTSTLLEYRKRGGSDPDALMSLAGALSEASRADDALGVLQDVLMVAPLRPEVHSQLGDRLLAAGRASEAVVEYRALVAMAPQDMADAHYRLAKAYLAAGDKASSREHLLYALETAPHYREAQQLLLEVVR